MELDDLSHIHFIQAIRRGLVSKTINVSSLGRPALKFKTVQSIYEYSKRIGSKQQKAEISGSSYRSGRFKTEMTTGDCEEIIAAEISLGEIKRRCQAKRKKLSELKNHVKDACFSPGDIPSTTSYAVELQKEDEADLYEPISSLKLKSLNKSKLKRRCFQKCVLTSPVSQESFPEKTPHSPRESLRTVENIRMRSNVKIASSESLTDVVSLASGSTCMPDPGTGSSVFLSHEAPRLPNRELAEQSSSAKASSTALCIVPEPINIKFERLETDDHVVSVADNHLYKPYSDMDYGEDKYHMPSTISGNESRSGALTSVTVEAPGVVIDKVTFECLKTAQFVMPLRSIVDDVRKEITKVELPQLSRQDCPSSPVLKSENECLINGDVEVIKEIIDVELLQLRIQDSLSSSVSEYKNEGLYSSDADVVSGITDVKQLSSQDYPSHELKFKNKGLSISEADIVEGVTYVEPQQLSSHDSPASAVLESKNKGLSISDAKIIGVTDVELRQLSNQDSPSSTGMDSMDENISVSDAEIVKGVTDVELELRSSHGMEFKSKGGVAGPELQNQPLITEDNVVKAGISFMSSQNSTQCSRLGNDLDSVGHPPPAVQPVEKCSSSAIDESVPRVVEVLDCSTITSPDATNKVAVMEVLEGHHGRKLDYPPKRLFSARKAISPSSQVKLLQAVDAEELCDKVKPSRIRIIGPKIKINPDGVVPKRRKIMKNGSAQLVPKGIIKSPNTECASIQTCADKAVAFTQRQMHDIEGLAMKLMKQLRSMKEIVEQSLLTETLQTDSCSSTQLKYTVDKMRMATENAAEAEETTKKWLSMMSKDCNRFCKILKTTEMKAAAAADMKAAAAASPPPSSYEVHSKRRKITFADETGGILCQVKIFEDHHESLLGPESEMAV